MIESSDLPKLWSAPDNSRLTRKQYSFRLPIHVAAKLAALEEMYSNRTRTEIVADLLTAALNDVERSFPAVPGEKQNLEEPHTGEPLYEDIGLGKQFREKANRFYQQLEREIGNKNPAQLYQMHVVTGKNAK